MATMLGETSLKNIWNSLFDVSVFSTCNENDVELQSIAMLLRKTFSLFEKLKIRCEEAEKARQEPCLRCPRLQKVISAHEEKLKQNESRMKSIAQILNLGCFTQESNSSPRRQQSMAKALTQILMGDDGEISEGDSEVDVKRKRGSISQKRDVEEEPHTTLIEPKSRSSTTLDLVVAPETLPDHETKSTGSHLTENIVLETVCSQPVAVVEDNYISDNEETYLEPKSTPTKQHTPTQGKTSPIIRRRKEKERISARKQKFLQVCHKLNKSAESVDQEEEATNQDMLTSSPILVGSKKSSFTAKLCLTREKGTGKTAPTDLVSTSTTTSNISGKFDETLVSPSLLQRAMPGFKASVKLHDVKSQLHNGGAQSKIPEAVADEKVDVPGKIKRDSGESVAQATSLTGIRTTGSAELDNILDIMCDTRIQKAGDAQPSKAKLDNMLDIMCDTRVQKAVDAQPLKAKLDTVLDIMCDTRVQKAGDAEPSKAKLDNMLDVMCDTRMQTKAVVVQPSKAKLDNMLDVMCDTHVQTKAVDAQPSKVDVKSREECVEKLDPSTVGQKRQADYWKLKPSACSKESISLIKTGTRLVQTKIAFGVHPEKTDICTVKEFNGGVRLSQTPGASNLQPSENLISPDIFAVEDFSAGIRPGLTSTMMTTELEDSSVETEYEKAILNSLLTTNTQLEDNDIISPSPELSLMKRTVYSQKYKRCRKRVFPADGGPSGTEPDGDTEFKENENAEVFPDPEELLNELGVPTQYDISRRTADLIRDFDKVPRRETDDPGYKYQRDAVRKRDERKNLGGWECADCARYYAGVANTSAERKQLMDKCSRHRNKYRRNSTPPGYWDPAFPSTPELRARNLDITQKPLKLRTRKNRDVI